MRDDMWKWLIGVVVVAGGMIYYFQDWLIKNSVLSNYITTVLGSVFVGFILNLSVMLF